MYIILWISRFKDVLHSITCDKESTMQFMKDQNVLKNAIKCPGSCVGGLRSSPCGNWMLCKKTTDSKDGYIWRCRKIHTIVKGNQKYTIKDVKLTVRHETWLVDCKLPLETVIELIYLWSQAFSVDEIIHELKLSKKLLLNGPISSESAALLQSWMIVNK